MPKPKTEVNLVICREKGQVYNKNKSIDAQLVTESFTENFVVSQSLEFSKTFSFKNTGSAMIKKGTILQPVGAGIQMNSERLHYDVAKNEYFKMNIWVRAP